MKAIAMLVVFILASLTYALPEKRFLFDPVFSLLNTETIQQDLQIMVNTIGSDPTEQMCIQECHKIAQQSLLDHGCPLLCQSFQKLVQMFQVTPETTSA